MIEILIKFSGGYKDLFCGKIHKAHTIFGLNINTHTIKTC